jgi:hypothetical protein
MRNLKGARLALPSPRPSPSPNTCAARAPLARIPFLGVTLAALHIGRCERVPRLADLCGVRASLDRHRPAAVHPRAHRLGPGSDSVRSIPLDGCRSTRQQLFDQRRFAPIAIDIRSESVIGIGGIRSKRGFLWRIVEERFPFYSFRK